MIEYTVNLMFAALTSLPIAGAVYASETTGLEFSALYWLSYGSIALASAVKFAWMSNA